MDTFEELIGDTSDDAVRIGGLGAHGLWGTTHVHEDDGTTEFRDCWEHFGIHLTARDVIDDVRACFDRGGGHESVIGIDRDGERVERGISTDVFNSGKNASKFFRSGDLRSSRPRRLAANVEDCCPVGKE